MGSIRRAAADAAARAARGIAQEAAEALLCWADTIADGDDDAVQVEADPDDPRPVKLLSPHGFYSVAVAGLRLLLARVGEGGFALGSYTEAPADATAGEAGIYVGGTILRVKPDGDTEIVGAGGTTITVDGGTGKVTISCPGALAPSIDLDGSVAVARDGDPVTTGGPATTWALWIVAVTTAINALNVMFTTGAAVLPTDFGVVDATSTKVRAG